MSSSPGGPDAGHPECEDAGAGAKAVVTGVGLHSAADARVTLLRRPGPVALRVGGDEAEIGALRVVSTARATTVEAPGTRVRVGTVEHAFAALAGCGIHSGLAIAVDGPEMPLLGGGAVEWCEALDALRLEWESPRLRVTHAVTYTIGPSRYEFSPASEVDVSVRLELHLPGVQPEAGWLGDPADFRLRIAPARTFALAHEIAEIARRGLARHVDPRAVVVLGDDAVHCAGLPFTPDEPARHKLLDLLGDLYLHGGPPLGRVCAFRPGHAANERAFRRALSEGVFVALDGAKPCPES
jgi:UDP-3-O-[3-hydroxymyristoyl] N-acetylglucosamine deacetylase